MYSNSWIFLAHMPNDEQFKSHVPFNYDSIGGICCCHVGQAQANLGQALGCHVKEIHVHVCINFEYISKVVY